MIQVCEPPTVRRQVRRLSAEEFFLLARQEACSFYRPRSEVLRMLTAGEVWGACGPRSEPEAALMVLPLNADTAAASALRGCTGWDAARGGSFLTPPVVRESGQLPQMVEAAAQRARRLARRGPVWSVLECTASSEPLTALYLKQGFVLRAMRPLESLAPCYLFAYTGPVMRAEPVWVPLADSARVARLLARGWAAVDSRPSPQGTALGLCPV